jgi:hypothetical protein
MIAADAFLPNDLAILRVITMGDPAVRKGEQMRFHVKK